MSRARNIKPGFFTNGDLLECQPLARLLFAGLWCEADRRGILEDRPKTLKVKILPGDNCDIDGLLAELAGRGFIQRYVANGVRCIVIPAFSRHQNPHVREQASSLPGPDESGASTVLAPDEHSTSPAESLLPITESLLLHPDADTPLPPDAEVPKSKAKPSRKLPYPDDFEVTELMRQWARIKYGLTDDQIDTKSERFQRWALKTGAKYIRWDLAWQDSMEWEERNSERGVPFANGRASPRSITADHAGEDRAYLLRGEKPVWGSAQGGIDSLDGR